MFKMAQFYTVILSNPILAILYVFLAIIVSWKGSGTLLGFWGNMILSLVITPVILVILIALFSDRRSLEKRG
jgi:hypothetical protein